jgi:hypothetical protein
MDNSPTADRLVIKITQERFASIDDPREALHAAISEIPDEQLRFARQIRVLLMA